MSFLPNEPQNDKTPRLSSDKLNQLAMGRRGRWTASVPISRRNVKKCS